MTYPSIRIEGAILSPDLFERLDDAPGQRPADFSLDGGAKVKDEIARAWADAQDYWRIFQRKLDGLKAETPATTETRNLWITPLLGLFGYQLEYQARGVELNGKNYPISHRAINRGHTPVHIVGYREPAGLDRKPVSGEQRAASSLESNRSPLTAHRSPKMSAHALVQEYLNLHDELYGIVTNGRILRLLRDSSRLIKLSYLEFDLDRIFTDGLFADFAVFYRLLHATRLPASPETAADSLIERYHQESLDSGARIRDGLARAVEQAIRDFANGFLAHRDNDALRAMVSGEQRAASSEGSIPLATHRSPLTAEQFYQHLLRLIYRLLFLLVIEERDLVFPPSASRQQRDIYRRYYSVERLRLLSEKRHLAEKRHHDLWLGLLATFRLFEAHGPGEKLGIAPLAGDLFDPAAIGPLARCQLGNDVFLGCLRALGLYQHPDSGQIIRVNYAALNVEEFGSVYEGLLEYQPVFFFASGERRAASGNAMEFTFAQGDQRAATGSHYTPDDLVQPLIKHALDYLINERAASGERRAVGAENLSEAEKYYAYQVLSGFGGLAAGHGTRGDGLYADQTVSQGRVVRHDIPDSSSGGVDSSQHRGGLGKRYDQGVSTVSAYIPREFERVGNPSAPGSESELGGAGENKPTSDMLRGSRSSVDRPTAQPYSEARFLRLWSSTPLAARRSLLAQKALLDLRVADIACGSGHILLAAARRIATELAIVRTGEEQPSPVAFRGAIRDVIRHCIYGVDLNPLAVELCKVALWLEAHNPGEPLNFLDHHIKCGNAIVGFVQREEAERGVPDEAFKTLPGDDRDTAALFRKRNKEDRKAVTQHHLDLSPALQQQLDDILRGWGELNRLPERTPDEIEAKKTRYLAFSQSQDAWLLYQIAAIPIAQFYLPKTPANVQKIITDAAYRRYWQGEMIPQGQATGEAWAMAERKHFFHWFLEFPEIVGRGGFDCILGNPPYLGGQALSGTYGHAFCEYVKWQYAPAGLSDLVAYFVRRIYSLLRPGGFTAFITTNSIKDGDIRKDGLEQVLAQGGTINMAVRGIKWPGRANLVVSLVALHKGEWRGKRVLDGKDVPVINAYFEGSEDTGEPKILPENANSVFQGSIFLGDGFLLPHEEADRLIQADSRNAEVIFPAINGQEVNNEPEQVPGRSIINFLDWPIEKARTFELPFQIIEAKVKPFRATQNRERNREVWWVYAEHRPGLTRSLRPIQRCFIAARTTKHLNFSAAPTHYVFTDALYVFTTDRWDLYAVVQSTLHEVWARKYSGALETRLRYSPSDCFETFPFPEGMMASNQRRAVSDAPLLAARCSPLATLGERYHEHRRALMKRLWLGLTDIYNLFHMRNLMPGQVAKVSKKPAAEAEAGYQGILELRRLHRELDCAIRDAYGWTDLDLGHDFHEVETLPENDRVRYTLSPAARKEVLKRLLAENHRRAALQVQRVSDVPASAGKKRGKKSAATDNDGELF